MDAAAIAALSCPALRDAYCDPARRSPQAVHDGGGPGWHKPQGALQPPPPRALPAGQGQGRGVQSDQLAGVLARASETTPPEARIRLSDLARPFPFAGADLMHHAMSDDLDLEAGRLLFARPFAFVK